ncbi:hypothetical protein H6F78_24435 [Coleofasciculus sp. FACHB-64]|nr:hypothetical protein [Coleofasciculus sp. FACHB-501]MBD1890963.1 hypothetical protein [Coleofasciculus sp. FACHB-SPT9]MBD1896842.1 hypothetical protein [Coleofasciculus sp. FACHB-129]MBD1941957.1 hypothetical protein [Coleofasciculus sp. FACHB-712]MBD2048709.1 hypothetical protein [Coleofasciculus sp. FACHB-64]MBD2087729.1 hypothetical protein [Coleofasciculus sp. FACHB-542]MBD2541346.1 hypothetical protein [Coleofasciculus sp. FACHB-SPT36]
MIRNQENHALTSIDGIAFIALLRQNGQAIAQETIDLIHADAGFDDLPIGQYTVVVRHERVLPQEVLHDVTISTDEQVIILTFVYLEPARVLLDIQASVEKRL